MREKLKGILTTEFGMPALKVKQLHPEVISETLEEWKERVAGLILTAIEEGIRGCTYCGAKGRVTTYPQSLLKFPFAEPCQVCGGKGWVMK